MKYNGSLDPTLNRKVVRALRKVIKQSGVKFDFIAFRGTSGALLSGPLSLNLNKRLVNVRKRDGSHGFPIEGDIVGKFIIIDDFIASGDTMREIFKKLDRANCLGIFITGTHNEFDADVFEGTRVFYSSREDVNG